MYFSSEGDQEECLRTMEGEAVMQKWEGLDTDDPHINTTNIGIEGPATFSTNEASIEVDAGIPVEQGENGKNNNLSENAKNKNLLPAPEPPIFQSSISSSSYVTTQSAPVDVVIQNKDEEQEFYLKKIFIMPPSHGFYCPNCKVCIEKVLVYKRQEEIESPEVGPPKNVHPEIDDRIRCLPCFRFLIPIGSQLFQGGNSGDEGCWSNGGKSSTAGAVRGAGSFVGEARKRRGSARTAELWFGHGGLRGYGWRLCVARWLVEERIWVTADGSDGIACVMVEASSCARGSGFLLRGSG